MKTLFLDVDGVVDLGRDDTKFGDWPPHSSAGKEILEELQLKNFRGFENHKLPLRSLSILVGRNNAGKSSIVEALRLIAIVTARYQYLAYHPPKE